MVYIVPLNHTSLVKQFLNFVWVGGLATALQYMVLIMLVQIGGVAPVLASAVGYTSGAGLSYFLNYHVTFASDRGHMPAIIKFFVVAGIGLAVNSFIVALVFESLGLNYLLAQVIATGLVLLWNFLANRLWTFRSSR